MKMAELITKIVRSSSSGGAGSDDIYYRQSSNNQKSRSDGKSKFSNALSKGHNSTWRGGNTTQIEVGDRDNDLELEVRDNINPDDLETGIVKTVQTTVASAPAEERDDADAESSSSTRKLHRGVFDH
jgi:hypothetical protein